MKKKTMFSILLVIAGYFILGGILFNHIFKPARPDMAVYLNEIRSFESTVEGFSQEIKKVENGWAYCRLKMQASAGCWGRPPVYWGMGKPEPGRNLATGAKCFLVNALWIPGRVTGCPQSCFVQQMIIHGCKHSWTHPKL